MFLIATALSAAAAGSAHASDTYGKLFGGAVFGSSHDITATIEGFEPVSGKLDTDLGYNVGGALGVTASKYFSFEGELAWRSNNVSGGVLDDVELDGDGDLNALSLMGNAILHMPNVSGLTPYVGAGAGGARVGGSGDHDIVFAYQLFGGINKAFGDKMTAGVEYRYFDAADATLVDSIASLKTEYDTHSVNLVLTRKF